MPSSETSLHWALSKLATHIPLSCSTSSTTAAEDALLATLSRTPLRRTSLRTTQPQTIGPLPALSRQLTDACFSAAQSLRDVCAATGRVDYEESKRLLESWDAAHAEQVRAWAEDAFASVRTAVANAKASSQLNVKPRKPVFHHEYTPLLDQYFELNAYPSAPDRAVLARKCMMSPRQIEVWFQNHRNRARRDGKPLRKLTDQSFSAELSLKTLEKKMPQFTIPAHERRLISRPPCSRDVILDNTVDSFASSPVPRHSVSNVTSFALNSPPPPHAFPTAYSPCEGNPIRAQDRVYTFPVPIWQRKPAISSSIPKTSIDMNEFILDFSRKLHLRGPGMKTYHPSPQPWYAGRVTTPCRAPHPALVHSPIYPTTSSPFSAQTDASLRFTHSPTILCHPSTLIPPESSCVPRRRKTVGLPKWVPSRARTHRDDSPAMSFSSDSSLSPSRSPSIGSDASSRRYSSSSSSSTCSSTLATPVILHSAPSEDSCDGLHAQEIYSIKMPLLSSGNEIHGNSRTPQ